MKPELKLGRPVLAGDAEPLTTKGKYLRPAMNGHYILWDNSQAPYWYRHVKIDLTAEPMNGDEVEVSDDGNLWLSAVYGHYNVLSKKHYTMQGVPFNHVRFPQQSKRDRVRYFIEHESHGFSAEEIADQIDKIYTEDK